MTEKTYVSCFYAQGETAHEWLDVFDELGAEKLIEVLATVNLIQRATEDPPAPLSSHLDHEKVGDFIITYSFSLGYIGVSMSCPMGTQIDIKV